MPLGLHSTYLCGDQPDDPLRANEYVHDGSFRPSTLWERPLSTAALGICSNAHDVARWEIALAAGDVVGDSVLGLMLEPTRLQDGRRVDYGLGTWLGELEGLRKFGATGGGASVRSAVAHYPELDLTVAILINTESESLGFQDAADLETSLTRLIAHLPVESGSR